LPAPGEAGFLDEALNHRFSHLRQFHQRSAPAAADVLSRRRLSPVAGGERALIVSVPSGNFGNLTAGLFAKRLGLPVSRFIAATNANDAVPRYS